MHHLLLAALMTVAAGAPPPPDWLQFPQSPPALDALRLPQDPAAPAPTPDSLRLARRPPDDVPAPDSLRLPYDPAAPDSLRLPQDPAAPDALRLPQDPTAPDSIRSPRNTAASPQIDHGPKIYPSPLYSTSAGFGLGLGYEVRNLFAPGSSLLTRNTIAQHLGVYTLSFFTGDPAVARTYGVLNGYYSTNGRHWFYGLGPASDRNARVAVEKRAIEAEARFAFQPTRGPLHLQPFVRYSRQEVIGYRAWQEGGLERLDEAGLNNLMSAAGEGPLGVGPVVSGIFLGTVAGVDTRDLLERTSRGVLAQATFERFFALNGEGIRFDRFGAVAYGFVPLNGGVVALRAASMLTRNRAETPVPFYHLAGLDGIIDAGFSWNRYTGNDLLVFSAEYRRPLMQVLGIVGLDVMATVSLASVYDDLFRQFTPGITLNPHQVAGRDRYQMHPVAAIGGRLVALSKDDVIVQGSIALDADGFGLTSLRVVYDLRRLQLSRR